jgi:hypothetical protein
MTDQLSLRKIDESNFVTCFSLELGPGQERFVSHPIRSLAQAYVYLPYTGTTSWSVTSWYSMTRTSGLIISGI